MKIFFSFIICFFYTFSMSLASEQYASIEILVNDRAITNIDIDIKAFEIAQANRVELNRQSVERFKNEAIDMLIEEKLLDIKADELGIFISDEELDDELESFRKQRNIGQAEFEELLERQNVSLSDFRADFLRQIKRSRVILREVRSKINIDEEEVKKEYEEKQGFEKLVRARHILFRLKADADEEDVVKTKTKAMDLKAKIEAGESFKKMADLYSEDPSVKRNHGDLGFFKKSDMVKPFSEAAFELEPGQISDPVRTPFGFHLIEVLEIKKQPKQSFEAVKDQLMNDELREKYIAQYQEYIADLKSKAKIVYK